MTAYLESWTRKASLANAPGDEAAHSATLVRKCPGSGPVKNTVAETQWRETNNFPLIGAGECCDLPLTRRHGLLKELKSRSVEDIPYDD